MPGLGGFELARKVRERNPAVRVLMMTGYSLDDARNNLTEGTEVNWLQKPFTVKQLTVAVRRALDEAKGQAEDAAGSQISHAANEAAGDKVAEG
jgi:DNA-binding NtrC family response regulator